MDHLNLPPILLQWIANMTTDVSRYVIFAFAVWLVLWVGLAGVLRDRKVRAETPPARQLLVEFAYSIRSIAVFSVVGLLIFFMERAGWLPGPQIAKTWGPIWFGVSLALIILGHDTWFYWTHRAMHSKHLFRTFHRRHHRSMNPSPFTAYSFDLGEAAINSLFVSLWVIVVPTPWSVVNIYMLIQIVRNTIGHSGYELFPATRDGRPLFPWLTTVTHHDLHHAEAGWNYGFYFTHWDRWMGTENPQYLARFAQSVRRTPEAVAHAIPAE